MTKTKQPKQNLKPMGKNEIKALTIKAAKESLEAIGFDPIQRAVDLFFEAQRKGIISEQRRILDSLISITYPKQRSVEASITTHNELRVVYEDQLSPQQLHDMRLAGQVIEVAADIAPEPVKEEDY